MSADARARSDVASFAEVGLHVLLPIGAGALLYVLARPTTLRVFGWLDAVGLGRSVASARAAAGPLAELLPGWVRFSLPNALWAYAFGWALSAVWGHRPTRASAPWLLVAPVTAVSWEVGQLASVVPGTFDPVDLALLLVASGLALWRPLARLAPATAR